MTAVRQPAPHENHATYPEKHEKQGSWGPALDNVEITETAAAGADCRKNGWKAMVDSVGGAFKNQGDCVSFYATGGKNAAG